MGHGGGMGMDPKLEAKIITWLYGFFWGMIFGFSLGYIIRFIWH